MMDNDKHREHVLEAVLMASELGDVSLEVLRQVHDADVEASDIDALVEEDLAAWQGDTLCLTEEGRRRAEDVIRRHRLVEVLLSSLLGLDRSRASEIGCMVEHDLRPEMVDSVCTFLGHPASCPHGRSIPAGSCCRAGRRTVDSQVIPLTSGLGR